ncbi:MAG: hypothetical protein HYV97_04205 [Bdellovibrio sp.]|nr:hypothetical protein [Bdellovibrio sp.]
MTNYIDIFNNACRHIENAYIDRVFINAKWPAIRKEYTKKIGQTKDIASFNKILTTLLKDELKLSHTMLITPHESEKIESLLSGENIPDYYKFYFAKYDGCLYLKIPTFTYPLFSMRPICDALSTLSDDKQIIVMDLRLNSGGSSSAIGHLLGPFIGGDQPYLIEKQAKWKEEKKASVIFPFPEEGNDGNKLDVGISQKHQFSVWHTHKNVIPHYTNPLIILSDQHNYSCGEVFVQALKEYERGKILGKISAGKVIGARDDFDCGEKYRLCLPFITMESANGEVLEGIGVTPDIEYTFTKEFTVPLEENELKSIISAMSK